MKVYRFMSEKEFTLLSAGCELIHTNARKAKTNSEGFCFLPEKVTFSTNGETVTFKPEQCIHFLGGIVTNDVLVEMETSVELHEGYGIYADPIDLEWGSTIDITEYSVQRYDRDTFIPVRYAMVDHHGKADWYSFN